MKTQTIIKVVAAPFAIAGGLILLPMALIYFALVGGWFNDVLGSTSVIYLGIVAMVAEIAWLVALAQFVPAIASLLGLT